MTARIPTALFVAMFLLYFSTSFGFFLFGDDISMLNVTESIVHSHSVSVRDVAFPASVPGRDGQHYSKYGIGQSLLAIPFYVAGSLVDPVFKPKEIIDSDGIQRTGTVIYVVCLLTMMAAAAVDVLVYLCSQLLGYSAAASFLTAVFFGAGTFTWYYSRTFLAESTSMLAVFGAFYALLMLDTRVRLGPIVVCAMLTALALLVRIGNVALVAPIGVWLLGKLLFEPDLPVRRFVTCLAAWTSIVLIGLLVVAVYDQARFGSPFETGYGAEANAFTTPLWVGLYGLVLSPGKGLFEYAPILIVGCLGWLSLLRQRRSPALVIAAVVLANAALYARWYEWWGGGVWGPRFVLPALPFIALGIPGVIVKTRSLAQRCLIAALALVSIGIQVLSVIVPIRSYFQTMFASPELFERYLWAPAASPIVAALRTMIAGNFSPDLAPEYYESTALAALQVAALVVAVVLLVGIARALAQNRSVTLRVATASPALSDGTAERGEPGSPAQRRSPV